MTVIRPILFALAVALTPLLGAAPLAAQAVQDFQLPPNPSSTPSTPAAQGPVDDSGIIARPPRAVNTPTPQPSATPTPTARPTPEARPTSAPASTRPAQGATPAPDARPTASPTAEPSLPIPVPNETDAPSSAQGAFDFSPAPAQPSQLPAEPGESGEIGGAASWYDYWPWALGIIAALVAAGWYWRSRRSAIASPPEIERPVVAKPSTSDTVTPPSIGGIALKLEAVSLSRSVMNLTLNYRLAITNQTLAMIERLGVSGDLITARGGVPLTQQVANSQSELPLLHEVTRLSGKQTKDLSGKLTLPVAELALARQGAPLYVPLVRLRIEGHDGAPKVQTFVIGMLPDVVGGKLQPFRIDEQPQTYSQIGQRSID